jgi:hypothetical protein
VSKRSGTDFIDRAIAVTAIPPRQNLQFDTNRGSIGSVARHLALSAGSHVVRSLYPPFVGYSDHSNNPTIPTGLVSFPE